MSVAKGRQIKTQIKEIEAFTANALLLAWGSMYTRTGLQIIFSFERTMSY